MARVSASATRLTAEDIDKRTIAYRDKLIRQSSLPPTPKRDRSERLAEQLARVQVRLAASDARRMRMLLQEARLHVDSSEWAKAYSVGVEFAHMARTAALGLTEAHALPAYASTIPAPSLGSGPPEATGPGPVTQWVEQGEGIVDRAARAAGGDR